MPLRSLRSAVSLALTLVALIAVVSACWVLLTSSRGLTIETGAIERTPITIYRPEAGPPAPVVVIAHGFAGSQQLMTPFAVSIARAGYIAITYDLAGHATNPRPMTGDITKVEGATQTLLREVNAIIVHARSVRGGNGKVAVLGHSMASDIVIRAAIANPDVAATIAVSMFSPAVDASVPRNLLVIVGGWEPGLIREAERAVGLVAAKPKPGETYGDPAQGTGRRFDIAAGVEHVGVLYSPASQAAALGWLDATFSRPRAGAPVLDARGTFIVLLLVGLLVLGRQLAKHLPVLADPPIGAGLPWARLWPTVALPMLVTPLVLRVVPTDFLPVLVGDYLAAHFGLYGLLAGLAGLAIHRRHALPRPDFRIDRAFVLATALVILFVVGVFYAAIDRFGTSFWPEPHRLMLVGAMLVGTLPFFLADEWLTHGSGHGRLAFAAGKSAFLVSLAGAVALDFERLFFLVIILPVVLIFFLVFGAIGRFVYLATGHPLVAGFANAVAFAVALGATFPMLGK